MERRSREECCSHAAPPMQVLNSTRGGASFSARARPYEVGCVMQKTRECVRLGAVTPARPLGRLEKGKMRKTRKWAARTIHSAVSERHALPPLFPHARARSTPPPLHLPLSPTMTGDPTDPPSPGAGGAATAVSLEPGPKEADHSPPAPPPAPPAPDEDTSGADTANTTEAGEPERGAGEDQVRGAEKGPTGRAPPPRARGSLSTARAKNLPSRLSVRPAPPQDPAPPLLTGKVFIGGLPPTASTPGLRAYAAPWGPLADAVVMEGRGFGFVTFEEAADAVAFLAVSVEERERETGRVGGVRALTPHPPCACAWRALIAWGETARNVFLALARPIFCAPRFARGLRRPAGARAAPRRLPGSGRHALVILMRVIDRAHLPRAWRGRVFASSSFHARAPSLRARTTRGHTTPLTRSASSPPLS